MQRLGSGQVALDIAARGASLPSSVGLTEAEQRAIADVITRTFRGAPRTKRAGSGST
jgi:hypothetical protein